MKNRRKLIAGIILAAGMSTRFGGTKQLAVIGKKRLLEIVVDAALASYLDQIHVVLGFQAKKVSAFLEDRYGKEAIQILENRYYKKGMSESIRIGLKSVQNRFSSVMILLGDQPLINANIIDLLIRRFQSSKKSICVPAYKGRRGHPVIFDQKFYEEMMAIEGDIGARNILLRNPDSILTVDVPSAKLFMDVDTVADVEKLKSNLKEPCGSPSPPD